MSNSALSSLSSNTITSGKRNYLVWIIVSQASLLFLTVNTEAFKEAAIFLSMSFLGLFIWVISNIVLNKEKSGIDFPTSPMWEENTLFGKLPKKINTIFVALFLIFGAYIFVSVGKTPTFEILTAPIFQVIPVGTLVSVVLSIFAATSEDLFFFLGITGLVFYLSSKFTRNFYLAFIITLFLVPLIFAGFHISRAGTSQIVSTATGTVVRQFELGVTYMFGLLMVSWVLVMRNVLFPLIIHAANNAAVSLFYNISLDLMLYFWIFTIFVIILTTRSLLKRG